MATQQATTSAPEASPLIRSAHANADLPSFSAALPITWRGYTFPPEPTVRFDDAAGHRLEVPAEFALADGLFDLPATNPERAAFLRDWVRSGCAPHGSINVGGDLDGCARRASNK